MELIKDCQSLAQITCSVDAMYTTEDTNHRIKMTMDLPFLAQLEQLSSLPDVRVLARQTRELRVVVRDEEDREHSMLVACRAPGQFVITETSLPFSAYQEEVYTSITTAVEAFRSAVSSLQDYFRELQKIDASCWVVDPAAPTFKDDYRRIVLEERVWLHVEVSPDAGGGRVRVVGAGAAAARCGERLAARLHLWRAASGVLDNVATVLEIDEFPQPPPPAEGAGDSDAAGEYWCAICLCSELEPGRGSPQPLCANSKCGSYLHAACLFQWLVAASNGVVPRLGVVSGKCPSCLAPISCSEHDA